MGRSRARARGRDRRRARRRAHLPRGGAAPRHGGHAREEGPEPGHRRRLRVAGGRVPAPRARVPGRHGGGRRGRDRAARRRRTRCAESRASRAVADELGGDPGLAPCSRGSTAAPPTRTARAIWTLDPIDGTKGFLRGEQYAVALGADRGRRGGGRRARLPEPARRRRRPRRCCSAPCAARARAARRSGTRRRPRARRSSVASLASRRRGALLRVGRVGALGSGSLRADRRAARHHAPSPIASTASASTPRSREGDASIYLRLPTQEGLPREDLGPRRRQARGRGGGRPRDRRGRRAARLPPGRTLAREPRRGRDLRPDPRRGGDRGETGPRGLSAHGGGVSGRTGLGLLGARVLPARVPRAARSRSSSRARSSRSRWRPCWRSSRAPARARS